MRVRREYGRRAAWRKSLICDKQRHLLLPLQCSSRSSWQKLQKMIWPEWKMYGTFSIISYSTRFSLRHLRWMSKYACARHAFAPSYSNLVGVANPPRSASCRRRRRLVTSIDFNIIWKSPSSDINNHPFIVQLSDTVSVWTLKENSAQIYRL